MRTTDKYGFKLLIEEPNTAERTVVVCPRYEGLTLKWSRPSGKMYFQREMSGTITFTGVDFDTVNGCSLRTKFTLLLYQRGKGEIARCDFRKTDCKWDINHQLCEVNVSAWNPYKKLEAGKDNEYNLIQMGLDRKALNLYVYPQNQVYALNDNKISFFTDTGDGNRLDVEQRTNIDNLISTGFRPTIASNGDEQITGSQLSIIMPIVKFTSHVPAESSQYLYFKDNVFLPLQDNWDIYSWSGDVQVLEKFLYKNGTVDGGNYVLFECFLERTSAIPQARLFRLSLYYNNEKIMSTTGQNYYVYNHIFICEGDPIRDYNVLSRTTSIKTYRMTSEGTLNMPNYMQANVRFCIPMVRLVTAQKISNKSLNRDTDIAAEYINNFNSYATDNAMFTQLFAKVSSRTSETPTNYGKVENTNVYYQTPNDDYTWVPIYKDAWFEGYSFWIRPFNYSSSIKEQWKSEEVVYDFYTLGDAIKAVVQKIDPSIVFEPDTDHSQFLFSTTNPVQPVQQGTLYISQKSNVLNLGYDYPAWQAPITWGKIETLLNNAFNCYWDIYEVNGVYHLRIEHRKFYEQGGSYTDSIGQTLDLRTLYRNSTPYTYAENTDRWEWEKDGGSASSDAHRYEYGWMDTQSAIFDGETIEIPEEYILFDNERVEERKVDWFSTDIDFLTSVPAECSSDGFVLVMESLSNSGWVISGAAEYGGQNYNLSLEYLQPKYLLAGIYSPVVSIGDEEYPNSITSRMRKAEIVFRTPDGVTVEPGDMLWTEVGQGLIESMEVDLSSGKYTATVRYENE